MGMDELEGFMWCFGGREGVRLGGWGMVIEIGGGKVSLTVLI